MPGYRSASTDPSFTVTAAHPAAAAPATSRALSVLLALVALLAGGRSAAAQTIINAEDGTGAQSGFGVVAPAGDIDGDGLDDLLVGAPLDDSAGTDSGLVLVLSGDDAHVLLTLHGAAPNEMCGAALAGVGDQDGDGVPDVLVGAPGRFGMVGHARVHSGATGAVLRALSGTQSADRFGAAVAAAGDLDDDGTGDFLVGAPGMAGAGTSGAPLSEAGAAFAVSGSTGSVLHVFHGEHAGDHLGASVGGEPVGALSLDQEPDVLVGCTQDGTSPAGSGLLKVYATEDWSLRFQVAGSTAGDRFGSSVAPLGDLDQDGHGELLVGGQGGYARLLSGATGDVLGTFSGATGTLFGAGVAGVGDVDGDLVRDFAIGEPGSDVNGTDAGGVHVYSGADFAELHVVLGPKPHASAGAFIACAGDVNADLLADVAIGAPGPGAGSAPGSVFTLSLTRWHDAGGGLPGIGDVPRLEGQGGLVANTEVALVLTGAATLSGVTLVLGNALVIDAASGTLTPLPQVVTAGLLTNAVGGLEYSFTWPTGMPTGSTVYYQFRIANPSVP